MSEQNSCTNRTRSLHLSPFALVTLTCAALAVGWPTVASADVITDWNDVALQAFGDLRGLAMMHLAQFDALDSINPRYPEYSKYAGYLPNAAGADQGAAANQAAYSVLSALYPSHQSDFNTALAARLNAIPDSPAKTAGINLGNSAASRVIALRSNDHFTDVVPYTPLNGPGYWQPTGTAMAPAANTQWPFVTPFVMQSGSQFRNLTGPPAITSVAFANALNQVKDLGSATSTTRTPDQTNIAKFWYLSPATTNGVVGLWNRVAKTVLQTHPVGDTLDEARLFALLNMAETDSFIASNDDKYHYNFWRPETAIHQAGVTYNNPLITGDPNWTPLLPAPAFPSYISNHASLDGAAANILDHFFTDNVSFTASTQGFTVPDRSFTSFSQAADEGAISRIYAGIHFPFDSNDGLATGAMAGDYAYTHEIPEPGSALALGISCGGILLARRRRDRHD